jgi:hypothetical protein
LVGALVLVGELVVVMRQVGSRVVEGGVPSTELEHTPVGENGVIHQNTFDTVGAEVYIQGVRMNGNVGQQIKEQAKIERAKREAKLKPQQWGETQTKWIGKRCCARVKTKPLQIEKEWCLACGTENGRMRSCTK